MAFAAEILALNLFWCISHDDIFKDFYNNSYC